VQKELVTWFDSIHIEVISNKNNLKKLYIAQFEDTKDERILTYAQAMILLSILWKIRNCKENSKSLNMYGQYQSQMKQLNLQAIRYPLMHMHWLALYLLIWCLFFFSPTQPMAFHWDSGWTCPFLSIYSYRHT
jgi:hypothetical protein